MVKCGCKRFACLSVFALLAFCGPSATAQDDTGNVQLVSPPDGGWPKDIQDDDVKVTMYQPQVESWDGSLLKFRAALSIRKDQPPKDSDGDGTPDAPDGSAAKESYGVAWVSARTSTDREARVVRFQAMRLDRVSFPSQTDDGQSYEQMLTDCLPQLPRAIALDRLEAALAIAQEEVKSRKIAVRNDPPKIFFSKELAALVLIDGKPVVKPLKDTPYHKVVNTRSNILFDKAASVYYLHLPGVWLSAASLEGGWQEVKGPTAAQDAALETARAQAALKAPKVAKPADASQAQQAGADPGPSAGQGGGDNTKVVITKVIVSTAPAELVQTDGDPRFRTIAGTSIQEVSNSPNNLFMDPGTAKYFVLLSGRWFSATAMEGPWTFTQGSSLPQSFMNIPENDPKGNVLASIPGTPQAKEALIAGAVPQNATVSRKDAKLDVAYDGDPKFQPIDGTALQYASNADTPVIRLDDANYFSVRHGVWFRSISPSGPWSPADSIPAAVYDIPPSSPVHHVTYVNVYDSTPDEITVGYTPGYLGSYVGLDNTVVYGTGWPYDPWVGDMWYPRPWTWGYDVAMVSGSRGGWTWSCAVMDSPGWGPACWGWDYTGGIDDFGAPWWTGMGPWGSWGCWSPIVPFNYNVYSRWNPNVVRNSPQAQEWRQRMSDWRQSGRGGPFKPFPGGNKPNNLFAGRDGQVYRRGDSGWDTHDGKNWKPVTPGGGGEGVRSLERENFGRMMGDSRMQSMRMPSMGMGGGMSSFGGFRRR